MLWDLLAALPLSPEWLAVRTEIASVFQNPNGHWQIFGTLALNAGLWAGMPVFLNWRRTAQRPSVSDWAFLGFLGLTVAHYAGRYSIAAGSTEALLILAGIWVAGIWRVVRSLQPPRRFWPAYGIGLCSMSITTGKRTAPPGCGTIPTPMDCCRPACPPRASPGCSGSPWGTARNNPTESASTFLANPIGPGWQCAPTPCTAARSGRTAIASMT